MTTDKFTQYPHIEDISEMPDVLELPEVIVTEKVHGSSMRIGLLDGVVRLGGRKLEFMDIRPDIKEGLGFISWVLFTGLDSKVSDAFAGHDIILYGEWHGSGTPAKGWPQVQKGVRYIKGNDFRVFDVKLDGKYLPQDEMPAWAEKVGLKTMPILYRGKPSMDIFNSLIDSMSKVGEENGIIDPENTIEGLVIRPPVMQWRPDRTPIMAKYKIGKWAERASQQKRPKTPKKPSIIIPGAKEFAEEFVTTMRLEHVISQLKEEGIEVGMKSLGEVMKRMGQDIKREGEATLIKAGLEWKDVSQFVTKLTKDIFVRYLKKL